MRFYTIFAISIILSFALFVLMVVCVSIYIWSPEFLMKAGVSDSATCESITAIEIGLPADDLIDLLGEPLSFSRFADEERYFLYYSRKTVFTMNQIEFIVELFEGKVSDVRITLKTFGGNDFAKRLYIINDQIRYRGDEFDSFFECNENHTTPE